MTDTSVDAFRSMEEHIPALRERVWRSLDQDGPQIAQELEERFSDVTTNTSSINARLSELEQAHPQRVVKTGQTRPTRSGREAHVWRAVSSSEEPPPRPQGDRRYTKDQAAKAVRAILQGLVEEDGLDVRTLERVIRALRADGWC